MPAEAHDADLDIETVVGAVAGATLTGVRYWETPCFGEGVDDEWPPGGPHRVGHGVDLIFGDTTVAVTWGLEELQVWPFSLVEFLLTGRFEAVNEKAPWSRWIGQRIDRVRVHWLDFTSGSVTKRARFALELRMASSDFIVLAAASYHDSGTHAFPGGDDIVVAWELDHIRNVLPDLTTSVEPE